MWITRRRVCGIILAATGVAVVSAAQVAAVDDGKARLMVGADTFSSQIAGVDLSKLPAEARAAFEKSAAHRSLSVRLSHTGQSPANPTATLAIPAGLKLGPTLPLLTDRAPAVDPQQALRGLSGSVKQYWGCGDSIRPGQPRVLASLSEAFAAGSVSPVAGSVERYAVWPNEKSAPEIEADAALPGDYSLAGNLSPAVRFRLPDGFDFLGAVKVTVPSATSGPIPVSWQPVQGAKAYLVMASGMEPGSKQGSLTMITWHSGERADDISRALDPDADPSKLIAAQTLLPVERTSCKIPAGIFDGSASTSVQVWAVGPRFDQPGAPRVTVYTRSIGSTTIARANGRG